MSKGPFEMTVMIEEGSHANPIVWRTAMHVVGAEHLVTGIRVWCDCGWEANTVPVVDGDTVPAIEACALLWGEHLDLSMRVFGARKKQRKAELKAQREARAIEGSA